jgi:FKBP-type peptidyl-prolyl cis-trans isomerase
MARPVTLALLAACAVLGGCQEERTRPYLPDPDTPPAVERSDDPLAPPADVSEPPANAPRSASGLAWRVLRPGSGVARPGPRDAVVVHYTGWRAENGEMFDSSRRTADGEPARFRVNQVIRGWTEGLQLMRVGERRRLWIPANLAYEGRPGPQGMLVFDVELLEIIVAPEAPPDVAAPPEGAERTESGLAHVLLEAGSGERHPTAEDRVRVHYTGWRADDGEMFDSSILRGQPVNLSLSGVIAGWTEGVPLMVEGEKRRFWIPEELAYGGRPGRPAGMLVFDIELVEIL